MPKRNIISRFWTLLCAALLMTGLAAAPASAAGTEIIGGTLLPSGQLWRVATPTPLENWNGTLLLDLDATGAVDSNTPFVRWLLAHGYAYGGINRSIVTYRYDIGADYLVNVRQLFIDHYGRTPTRTLAYGVSRGCNVARVAIQLYPQIFDGAATGMGCGAGQLSSSLLRLDSQFVLKTLVNPASPLKIVNVPNTAAGIAEEEALLADLVTAANATSLGRARLALAGAVSQTGPWLQSNEPEPAPDDWDAQYAQLMATYVDTQGVNTTAGATEIYGGNFVWNNGVNYRHSLEKSGRKDFVRAMYRKVASDGLHLLDDDLRTLRDAPRISADPQVVAFAEQILSFTGEIPGPIFAVNNIGDINYPPAKEVAYEQTLRKAGNKKLHEKAWVRSAGHGNINATELLVGINIVIDCLDTGKWHYTKLEEQSALAEKIRSEGISEGIVLPAARFMEYNPDKPLRTWDVSNYNTYQP